MRNRAQHDTKPIRRLESRFFRNTQGSQIAEFAVALPLIIVFVIGIYDFSQAYGLKQRLGNAARDGARIGASQPTADLSQAEPATVDSIARVVGTSLQSAGINDCGLSIGNWTVAKANLTWTYQANNGCSSALTLTIDRGFSTTATIGPPYDSTMTIDNTRVTLSYPYQWRFGNVATLVVPSANYARGTTQIQATATMQNLN
jgi:Flp pilus assembly protein TadG